MREQVEQLNSGIEGTILNYLSTNAVVRVLSLRQDLSSAFNRLLHSPVDTPVKVQFSDKYVLMFVRGRNLKTKKAILLLKTAAGQGVNNFRIEVNGANQAGFAVDPQMGGLWSKDVLAAFAGGVFGEREHTLSVKNAGDLAPAVLPPGDVSALDSSKLLDVILYVEYQLA